MNRREFLMWVGVGGVASSLPLAIAACTPQNEQSEAPASPLRADGFQSMGTVAELNQKGQIKKELAKGSVLIVSNSSDNQSIKAVNPICTHKGCTVDWKTDKKAFVCPCHGAQFSPDGKVLKGPAKKSLSTYEAKIEGDLVLVKANKR